MWFSGMKISVIPNSSDHLTNLLFTNTSARDDVLASYRAIKEAAEERGWSMATFDQLPIKYADKVLAFNFEAFPEVILEALDTLGTGNMVAVVREPPEIAPLYYDQDIQRCFGAFYLPEMTSPDNRNSFYLAFPVSPADCEWVPFERKKLLVSITSGKLADFEGSLYRERVKAIKHFQASLPKEFDMFGQGWERNTLFPGISPHKLFPSYRGTVSSKHEAMRKHKFSICYENSNNVCGYVSEKIFDSMRAGCVPIYLGAPDIQEYVPKECFVDLRQFNSYPELEQYIVSVNKRLYQTYLDSISEFLKSDSYLDRLPDRYAHKILSLLEKENDAELSLYSEKGKRKLKALAAIKGIRHGNVLSRYNNLMLLIKYEPLYGWSRLLKYIWKFFLQKSGFSDLMTWLWMKAI